MCKRYNTWHWICIQNEVAASKNEIPCNYISNILDLSCSNLKKYVLINTGGINRETDRIKISLFFSLHASYSFPFICFCVDFKTHTSKENTILVSNNNNNNNNNKELPITILPLNICLHNC